MNQYIRNPPCAFWIALEAARLLAEVGNRSILLADEVRLRLDELDDSIDARRRLVLALIALCEEFGLQSGLVVNGSYPDCYTEEEHNRALDVLLADMEDV